MNDVNYKDREGNVIPVPVSNNKILETMFSNVVTRSLLKLASSKWYSNLQRAFLVSPFSTYLISGFVRKNHINMKEYPKKFYRSFNDFFTREIKAERRIHAGTDENLISPCDCKASAYRIEDGAHFQIKGVDYTVGEVLKDDEMAKKYIGGTFFLLRLCVEDYHHYCYPCSGHKSPDVDIAGALYTVHPMIHRYAKAYRENARTYSVITDSKGNEIIVMEVGALGVGRIVNDHPFEYTALQGVEMGHFEFGGSTVLVICPPGSYVASEDLLRNTNDDFETIVKMGEEIGYEDHS